MAIEIEKLLVLKAFYMGHAIFEKKHNIPLALKMVNTAIEQLEPKNEVENKVRLLFYLLLKAEIERGSDKCIYTREKAMNLDLSIRSPVFKYYMLVQEATQTRKKAYGSAEGFIADKGIQTTASYVSYGFNPSAIYCDVACRALSINESKLSKSEESFLKNVNLKEMLDKHGITYNPSAEQDTDSAIMKTPGNDQ